MGQCGPVQGQLYPPPLPWSVCTTTRHGRCTRRGTAGGRPSNPARPPCCPIPSRSEAEQRCSIRVGHRGGQAAGVEGGHGERCRRRLPAAARGQGKLAVFVPFSNLLRFGGLQTEALEAAETVGPSANALLLETDPAARGPCEQCEPGEPPDLLEMHNLLGQPVEPPLLPEDELQSADLGSHPLPACRRAALRGAGARAN